MRRVEGRPEFIPHDTTPDAYWAQVEALRRMGGRGRSEVMFRLTDMARKTAMAGIRSRHPNYDEDQVLRAFARLVLGDALVREVWPDKDLVEP
jgi:hypothetical protein